MFKDIKVGDPIIVHKWMGSFRTTHSYTLTYVTNVNKRTFKVEKYPSKTFTKDYGSVYRGSIYEHIKLMKYDKDFYEQKQKEQAEQKHRAELIHKLRTINFDSLSMEQLEKINDALVSEK